ncbi:MAG TPA: NifU family protein [Isosphaeraceae bacterium]|nr:NifU family protein [Isosphaeraceae bacterium]
MPESSPQTRDQILDRIQNVLNREVRGVLAPEGDAVEVVDLDADNVLLLRLTGACGSCASSAASLSMMIEQLVRAEVPEVRFVEAVP